MSLAAQNEARLVLLIIVALGVALIARKLRFPYTLALVLAGLALGITHLMPDVSLDPEIVLFIFIPALLFEGAWTIDVAALRRNWLIVLLLAAPGLLLSLIIVALFLRFGSGLSWSLAFLLGAIVSPSDPIAVVALFRQLGMSERLRTIVEGESLFNDGVGAAAYTIVLAVLLTRLGQNNQLPATAAEIGLRTVWLFIGGPLIGIVVGLAVSRFERLVDDHLIETTLTLGVAYGVYLLGDFLRTSGLLAVVTTGIIMGSYGRAHAMSERTRAVADDVWEFIGYVANSLLFLVLGVQIGATPYLGGLEYVIWGVAGVIVGRAIMIYGVVTLYNAIARWYAANRTSRRKSRRSNVLPVPSHWRPLLLLSGLRGALSLALVLSLPLDVPKLSLLQLITYGVVLVTLVGQGIGMRFLLPRWPRTGSPGDGNPKSHTAGIT